MIPPLPTPKTEQEKLDWLQLIRSDNVGPITFFKILSKYGTARNALEAIPTLKTGSITLCEPSRAAREYEACAKRHINLVFFGDTLYPPLLQAIPDAPPVISVLGNPDVLSQASIGIVGARNASLTGKKFAHNLAQDLTHQGYVVASGLARGIDTHAHQGALKSGMTIAVLAGGIDIIYPPENELLYKTIQENGAVISEIGLGTQPQAKHFPRRNRLISGLSSGVVVVEAALKSGSLITARFALEQGREVFAVPGSPLDPRCRGSNNLIRHGAILTEGIQDVLENFNHLNTLDCTPKLSRDAFHEVPINLEITDKVISSPTNGREHLLENLGFSPIGVDELIRQCHISPQEVRAILLELELSGHLERHADDRVSLLAS